MDSGIQLMSAGSSGKRQRSATVNNRVLLTGLKDALQDIGSNIANAIKAAVPANVDTSPEQRTKAKEKIQNDELNLDAPRLCALVDLFTCDTEAADTYLVLFWEDLRKFWVEKVLTEKLGFPALSPLDMDL